jgi:rubrerythrin
MPDLKGTKTEKNLLEAFAGESQARNKYTYFASIAKKEGYEQIAAIFLETAENEKEHAKLHFRALAGLGNTIANLKVAAAGELYECSTMYPEMAKTAREEGFAEIAATLEGLAAIEKTHKERYERLLKAVETQAVFRKTSPAKWVCRNCGHVHEGPVAPDTCPVCKHPKAYFELKAENY